MLVLALEVLEVLEAAVKMLRVDQGTCQQFLHLKVMMVLLVFPLLEVEVEVLVPQGEHQMLAMVVTAQLLPLQAYPLITQGVVAVVLTHLCWRKPMLAGLAVVEMVGEKTVIMMGRTEPPILEGAAAVQ